MCTETPSDAEVRQRLRVLTSMVHAEEPGIRRWFTSFALLHGTMLTASALLAVSARDEGYRNEMIVGTTSSTLALASLVLFTPPMMGAGDAMESIPDDTPEGRLARMREGEDRLRRGAASVDFLHSWVPSTLSLVYVAGASMTNLLAFERTTGAYTHAIGGTVLGLARILLHPTGPRTAWRRYRNAHPDAGCVPADEPVARLPAPSWRIEAFGLGASIRLTF